MSATMSSNSECKSELARSLDVTDGNNHSQNQSRTNLNDLAIPPKACASPLLCKEAIHCGSISTDFGYSQSCTVPPEDLPTRTSITLLAPKYSTTQPITLSQPPLPAAICLPSPISIPPPTLSARDINRIPTPLSARGDRKGHLFPYTRTPSPRSCSYKRTSISPTNSQHSSGYKEWTSAFPAPTTPARSRMRTLSLNMHNEPLAIGRYPTSPLSPKPPSTSSALSPQHPRRGNHGRQASRNMQLNLGRYHPSNFTQVDSPTALGSSATSSMQAPQITYARAPAPVQIESPRLLREKHREFIEKARQSSKLAASPFATKPDAPRLDPLGSPNGAVTPLALEEAGDYFTVSGSGKLSPAASPGTRSPRAASISSDEGNKPNKSRKLDQ